MHEVIHISNGPRANYLNTSFYNAQINYFVYTDEDVAKSFVDPSIRFKAGKEYTPRSLFWDFRHGFGSKAKYSGVYEKKESPEKIKESFEGQLETLDISAGDQKSWTDQFQLPIHPSSMHELSSWEFNKDSPQGHLRGSEDEAEFLYYEQGVEEYKTIDSNHDNEYLDQTVRRLFENCDLLQGLNVCTEFNGWGGWTASMLEQMRDDYAHKLPIFTWAAINSEKKVPRAVTDSRLETFLSFSELSSLVIPLSYSSDQSLVDMAAQQNLLFETIAVASSLRKERYSMSMIVDDLTVSTNANIVSGLVSSTATTRNPDDLYSLGIQSKSYDFKPNDFSNTHTEAKTGFTRATKPIELTPKESKLQWASFKEDSLLEQGVPEIRLHKIDLPQYMHQGTNNLVFDQGVYAELSLNNGPLSLRKLVAPWKHEQKERVYDLTESYVWKWESDSDYE